MSYLVSNAKDDLEGILGGTTVNNITNLNSLLARGGRRVLSRIDPAETLRISALTLEQGTYVYDAPLDLKDKKVRALRPQSDRTLLDDLSQVSGDRFDLYKEAASGNNTFQVVDYEGAKQLLVSKDITPATTQDYWLEYYSTCIFRDSQVPANWTETINASVGDDTIINLGLTSYNIFLYECALLAAQQTQGDRQAADVAFFRKELFGDGKNDAGLYGEYQAANPTESIDPQTTYYNL